MSSPRTLCILLVAALTLFHLGYIASGRWDLSPDEAHYWEWSRNLDLGYYSKGPVVALLIAGSVALGGPSELFVRLPAVLIAAGVAAAAFALALGLLRDERAALMTVVLLSLMPLFAAGALLMTIDPPFVLFWTLALLAAHRAVERRSVAAWYATGILFGLGLLTKYTMAMLVPCLFLYLLLSPRGQPWLLRREPYLALGFGLVVFSPNLIWNARHGWVSFRHAAAQAAGDGLAPSATTLGEFLGAQALVFSPLLFLILLLALARSVRLAFRREDDAHLFLCCASAPVLAFFLAWSLLAKVQANWPAHGYVAAAISAAAWWEQRPAPAATRRTKRALKSLRWTSIIVALAILLLGHFPEVLGLAGLTLPRRLDPISGRLLGWRMLGERVSLSLRRMPRGEETFLISDRYQVASELAFYVAGQPRTYAVNLGRRLNQYDLWPGIERFRGRDALFVAYGEAEVPRAIQEAFARVVREPTFRAYHRGVAVQTFTIFRGFDFRGLAGPPRPPRY